MQSDQTFRWGIVGTGGIARQFADDLKLVPGARLAAVCSRSIDTAKRFAPEAKAFADLADLLASNEVDGIYLATPNHVHAAQALQSIAAGKPVLVEKPVATTSADAEAVFSAAAARKVFAMEAMWTRFLPAAQKAKQLLTDGVIGVPQRVEADLAFFHDPVTEPRFYQPDGGGAALDLGVYPLSLAMFLLGDPENVHGRWTRGQGGVNVSCVFDLKIGGVQATLTAAIDRTGHNQFTVYGSKGALRIHANFLKAQRLTVYGPAIEGVPFLGTGPAVTGKLARVLDRLPIPGRRNYDFAFSGNGLQFEAEAFARAVRAGETASSVATPQHSIAVLQAIETVLSQPPAS